MPLQVWWLGAGPLPVSNFWSLWDQCHWARWADLNDNKSTRYRLFKLSKYIRTWPALHVAERVHSQDCLLSTAILVKGARPRKAHDTETHALESHDGYYEVISDFKSSRSAILGLHENAYQRVIFDDEEAHNGPDPRVFESKIGPELQPRRIYRFYSLLVVAQHVSIYSNNSKGVTHAQSLVHNWECGCPRQNDFVACLRRNGSKPAEEAEVHAAR